MSVTTPTTLTKLRTLRDGGNQELVRLSERVILNALEHDVVLIKRKRINTTTLDHVASADDAYKETDRHTR